MIHADGKKVAIDVLSDVLVAQSPDSRSYKVYRRKSIDPDTGAAIVKSAKRYFARKYSFISYFKSPQEADVTQFCSRLIAYAYRSAKLPITHLADHRVLPLHLFRACQSVEWEDISDSLFEKPIPPEISNLFGGFEELGLKGVKSLDEFSAHANSLMRQGADIFKEAEQLRYKNAMDVFQTWISMNQLVAAKLQLAKLLQLSPEQVDDTAATIIARVLEQIAQLLELSRLDKIDRLINDSVFYATHDQNGESLFVGLPHRDEIYALFRSRERLSLYGFFLFAQIGLCSILAGVTSNEKFSRFATVKPEYVSKFIEALSYPANFREFAAQDDTFTWVDVEEDRRTCQQTARNIVLMLEVIDLCRKAASRG